MVFLSLTRHSCGGLHPPHSLHSRDINIRSWSESIVPNFVTSNSFIACCYAKLVMGYLRDYLDRYLQHTRADRKRTGSGRTERGSMRVGDACYIKS